MKLWLTHIMINSPAWDKISGLISSTSISDGGGSLIWVALVLVEHVSPKLTPLLLHFCNCWWTWWCWRLCELTIPPSCWSFEVSSPSTERFCFRRLTMCTLITIATIMSMRRNPVTTPAMMAKKDPFRNIGVSLPGFGAGLIAASNRNG